MELREFYLSCDLPVEDKRETFNDTLRSEQFFYPYSNFFLFNIFPGSSGVSWEEWWTYDGISGKFQPRLPENVGETL